MLIFLKLIHTLIWIMMTAANFTAFYYAFNGIYDFRFWVPAGLIVTEIITILVNRWTCPLTPITAKYTENRKPNFDIFLPEMIAKYNKEIFTVIIIVEVFIILLK